MQATWKANLQEHYVLMQMVIYPPHHPLKKINFVKHYLKCQSHIHVKKYKEQVIMVTVYKYKMKCIVIKEVMANIKVSLHSLQR